MKYLGLAIYLTVVSSLASGFFIYQKSKDYPIKESIIAMKKVLVITNVINKKYEYFNN